MSTKQGRINIVHETVDESAVETLDIIAAEYAGEYKIHLWFSDGKDHVIDFATFVKIARNPSAIKYRNLKEFRQFQLDYGNLHWNDYEMCFSTQDLYNNDIDVELDDDVRQKLTEIEL